MMNAEKKCPFDCVSASFLPSSSDFLSQSRPNKGPHRHRIKQYCLAGGFNFTPSQATIAALSSQFVTPFCALYLSEVASPQQLPA